MVNQGRARSVTAKAARQASILQQTLLLWQRHRYEEVTLQLVAEQMGLSKPALYSYFSSKESLFLSLYEQLVAEFLSELAKHLQLGGQHSPRTLAILVSTLLLERPEFIRLVVYLATLLERNISPQRALEHKLWLLDQLASVTLLIEAKASLPAGLGLQLLTYTQAMLAGLYPMSDLAPAICQALENDELSVLKVDFKRVLPEALAALYTGLAQT